MLVLLSQPAIGHLNDCVATCVFTEAIATIACEWTGGIGGWVIGHIGGWGTGPYGLEGMVSRRPVAA